jgi:hypothetical protein
MEKPIKSVVRARRQSLRLAFAVTWIAAIATVLAVMMDSGVAEDRDPRAAAFRTGDLIVDNVVTLGSGSAVFRQYTGNPNTAVGAVKGSLILDTSTPAVWYNSTGSNVWIQLGSGGGGGGSGFSIAGWGLVGSGSTVSIDASGCGSNSGWVLTWNGSNAWTCGAQTGSAGSAVTPSLAISQAVTTGTPNLTTLGTQDWMIPTDNIPKTGFPTQHGTKTTGGRLIEYPLWTGSFFNIAVNTRAQLVTWTATDLMSQGSAGAGYGGVLTGFNNTGVVGWGFVTSVPSSTVTRTFVIYVGNFNETDGVTCSANMVDGEVSGSAVSFTLAGSSDDRTLTTVYRSAQATRVNVQCLVTSNPAGANLGWLAMYLQ